MFLFIQNKTAILKVTDPSKASFANYFAFASIHLFCSHLPSCDTCTAPSLM